MHYFTWKLESASNILRMVVVESRALIITYSIGLQYAVDGT